MLRGSFRAVLNRSAFILFSVTALWALVLILSGGFDAKLFGHSLTAQESLPCSSEVMSASVTVPPAPATASSTWARTRSS